MLTDHSGAGHHRPPAKIPSPEGRNKADGSDRLAHPHRRPTSRSRAKFWLTAYTFMVLAAGANLATPLYRSYQADFGFSPLMVTLIFASYVAALIPTLVVAGSLSDAIGRRRVLLPAVALAVLGALVFANASSTGWLFIARILQGLSVGLGSGTLTATLNDLEPTGSRRRAALVSGLAAVIGIGVGPLMAGALAEYAPAPHVLPYVVEVVLLVPAALTILTLPDTTPATRWRPRRPSVPAVTRPAFVTGGLGAFLAFAVTGLFLSLAPRYVSSLSGSDNLALSGAAVALLFAIAALAQRAGFNRAHHHNMILGLPLLTVGLVLLAVAGSASSLSLLLVAVVFAGTGQGLVFLGGLTAVNNAVPAGRHAEVLSSFYVVAYLGVGLPVIGVGVLATRLGLLPAVEYFSGTIAALALILLAVLLREHRRTSSYAPATAPALDAGR